MKLFEAAKFTHARSIKESPGAPVYWLSKPVLLLISAILILPIFPESQLLASASSETSVSVAPVAIRIKAGIRKPMVDADGNTWLPDQGFVKGVIADRDVITPVANTRTPALYLSERYGMTEFSHEVPNGRYVVKLHFAEMYGRVTGAGQRVFSFNVEGHEFKNFDIWALAGGSRRAYIETVEVEVTEGKLNITFTPNVQYPVINAVEIIAEAK